MRTLRFVSAILSLAFASIAVAGDFDGVVPLTCAVKRNHDCLSTKASCDSATPDDGAASTIGIDFAKKQIRSPYKKALLPVQHATTNTDSLVLQGGDQFIAWSALVDRKTGALTVALADSSGVYAYFGVCKAAGGK